MKQTLWIVFTLFSVLAAASVAQAERLSVKTDIANVRSGPNTSDAVIWQVEKYHPLNVVRTQGDWCLFEDFEGDRGWIHRSLLDTTRTVIVKKNKCNVRSGPGTGNAIRFTVDKGIPFKVIEEKGDWLHVIHADGDKGWLHRALLW
ncbi:SH3 domain-containing protein [uncultured Desulfosarcina sp.]|uniref:SH3 domain-containing protein n=1 Tax=uncultured Desulfosarcina sp. TaxID=218289 RepID=UPI0029C7DC5D|nr:SH3 domain-containing protein [uncultured Desulfosarcina sp.]